MRSWPSIKPSCWRRCPKRLENRDGRETKHGNRARHEPAIRALCALHVLRRLTPTALIAVSGLPRNEAAILLTAALEVSPVWLVTHANEALIERASDRACAWFERRRAGEPVAYRGGRARVLRA